MSKEIYYKFKLKLNIESWGKYRKGDEDYFIIPLLDEQNGLVRYPIEKFWDIVSCELYNDEETPIKDKKPEKYVDHKAKTINEQYLQEIPVEEVYKLKAKGYKVQMAMKF